MPSQHDEPPDDHRIDAATEDLIQRGIDATHYSSGDLLAHYHGTMQSSGGHPVVIASYPQKAIQAGHANVGPDGRITLHPVAGGYVAEVADGSRPPLAEMADRSAAFSRLCTTLGLACTTQAEIANAAHELANLVTIGLACGRDGMPSSGMAW